MKTIIILCTTLTLVVISGLLLSQYLQQSTQMLTAQIAELEAQISQKNWHDAERDLSSMHKKWQTQQNIWALFIDHQEIDNIELTISRMESYIKNKNKDLSLGELSALAHWLTHIPEKEAFTLGNIF